MVVVRKGSTRGVVKGKGKELFREVAKSGWGACAVGRPIVVLCWFNMV